MADEQTPNRATLALVYSEIGNLRGTVAEGFTGIQRQLEAEDDATKAEVTALARRLDVLEDRQDRGHEWIRGPLLLGGIALVATTVNALITIYHH